MSEWLVACWFVVIIVLVCYFMLFGFILFSLRIRGSQNWWFVDPRFLRKKTESNPSIGGSQLILRGCDILFLVFPKTPDPSHGTPDPPSDTPGASKQVVLTPHDIPRILRVVCFSFSACLWQLVVVDNLCRWGWLPQP